MLPLAATAQRDTIGRRDKKMEDTPKSLDDQPGLMKGRHDPIEEFSMEQKLSYLEAVLLGLGKSWLASPEENPIRNLWRHTEWLATSELLHFGKAICDVRTHGAQRWLSDHMKRIRTNDPQGARGSAFEICAASMLSTDGQQIDYAQPSQPGYDLLLSLPTTKSLRISCKVLCASAYARQFPELGHELFRVLRKDLNLRVPIHIHLTGTRRAPRLPSPNELVAAVRGALVASVVPVTELGPWRMALTSLRPFSDAEYFGEKASLGLTIHASHLAKEQTRFNEKIEEACSNLASHAPAQDCTTGNVVFIKVPESIALDAAIDYALKSPLRNHPNVAGVFLFRTAVCSNGSRVGLGHQFKVVANPNSTFPLSHYAPSGTLAVNLLTGVPIDGKTSLGEDAYRLPSPHFYSFERQHHHYTRTVRQSRNSRRNRHVKCDTPPFLLGLSCDWTIFGKKRIDLTFTHCVVERELVLL